MTTWSYGGTALTTYGKVVLINDDFDFVQRRGENITLPFRHGERFVSKYYGGRTLTFGIVMTAASAGAMETLIDSLKAKLAPRTEQALSCTREDTTIRTIQATVDVSIEPDRKTAKVTFIVLTFKCASPFFRLSTSIASNVITVDASPKAWSVTNPGTAEETEATIILTGPLSNTVITNSTNGFVITYTGIIASPRVVTISVDATTKEFIASDDLGADKIANITHSGGSALMLFNVGSNTMSIADDTATTGTVEATFKAPFL